MLNDFLPISELQSLATRHQLLLLGTSDLLLSEDATRFKDWLEKGMAGDMFYMHQHTHIRLDPTLLLESAKSAMVFASQYHHKNQVPHHQAVAKYAQFKDYHRILRRRITAFAKDLKIKEYRVCVDSAPVLERALARKTHAGFIGKNSCFISPVYGSFLLLGVLLVDEVLETAADVGSEDCGTCRRCQVHCPTGAIVKDRVIDSRRCLSYLSIEHRGRIPKEFWPHFKTFYYGCDICQDVCPFNRRAKPGEHSSLGERLPLPDLLPMALMDQKEYEKWFGGSPLTRAKRDGLQRNALLALWASHRVEELRAAMHQLKNRTDTSGRLHETLQQLEDELG